MLDQEDQNQAVFDLVYCKQQYYIIDYILSLHT